MSEAIGDYGSQSLLDKINKNIHHRSDSSSSSESDSELKTKVAHLFGRRKPVHTVLGGGAPADIILWRNKRTSAGILLGATALWILFEWRGYHLLTLICQSLMLLLAVLFCWSNASYAINKSPPKYPEIILPEAFFISIAQSLRFQINRAFATFREVASGKDVKKFLKMIAALWVVSVIGGWFNFLTLFYMAFVLLETIPVLYEKNEDRVDTLAQKAMVEINKQYAVLDANIFQKIPHCPFMDKKQH